MFRVYHSIVFVLLLANSALAWRDDIYPPETYAERESNRYHVVHNTSSNPPLWGRINGYVNLSGNYIHTYINGWDGTTNVVVTNWTRIGPRWNGIEAEHLTNRYTTSVSLLDALDMDAWLAVEERAKWISSTSNNVELYMFRIEKPPAEGVLPLNSEAPLQKVKNWVANNVGYFVDPTYISDMGAWFNSTSQWAWVTNTVRIQSCVSTAVTVTTYSSWQLQRPKTPPFLTVGRLCEIAGLPYEKIILTGTVPNAFGWQANDTNSYMVNTNLPSNPVNIVYTNYVRTYFDVTPWRGLDGSGPSNTYLAFRGGGWPYDTNIYNAIAYGFTANDYTYKKIRDMFAKLTIFAREINFVEKTNDATRYYGNNTEGYSRGDTNTWFVTPCYQAFCGSPYYSGCLYETNLPDCGLYELARGDIASISDPELGAETDFVNLSSNVTASFYERVYQRRYVDNDIVGAACVLYSPRKTATAETVLPEYSATVWFSGHVSASGTLRAAVMTTGRSEEFVEYCPPYYDSEADECFESYNRTEVYFSGAPFVLQMTNVVYQNDTVDIPDFFDGSPRVRWETPDAFYDTYSWEYTTTIEKQYLFIEMLGEYK